MNREPGRMPTGDLDASLSRGEARPGDQLVLTITGSDGRLLGRGKALRFEMATEGGWEHVGMLVAGRQWVPAGSSAAMTMEGYPATSPHDFTVPNLPPGNYRLRMDAIATADHDGEVLDRTATFYVALQVLDPD